jgi:hypothetical protein
MRLAGLLVAFVIVAGAWSAAQARIHSLGGNARFQIGDGLPIPIGFSLPPGGRVMAIPGATIRQHGHHVATDPASVVMDPFQMTYDAAPINLPLFNSNPAVFQVKTDLSLNWPKTQIKFWAGGRTGPATVTFCGKPPSTTVIQGGGNPGCVGGPIGTGLLKYTATSHQFGGPAQGLVGGVADVALRGGIAPPCAGGPGCVVAFFDAGPASMGAVGAMFGFTNMTVPTAPSPGAFFGVVGGNGTVLSLSVPLGPGLTNGGSSWGGPWTTGMLTASAPTAGPPEKFTLSGSDNRSFNTDLNDPSNGGQGSLSLVAGGFSQRSISGPNANRGWANFQVGPKLGITVPTLSQWGIMTLGALLVLMMIWTAHYRSRAAAATSDE